MPMRVLLLIVGSFLALILSLASIRFWGLGQQYIPYDNRFFQPPKPWVICPWEQGFFVENNPQLILWAQVYSTQNHLLLVAPSLEKVLKNRDREQTPSPARPLLSDLVKKYPKTRWILSVSDNIAEIPQLMASTLELEKRSERIMIQSEFNNVLTATKELMPRWVYGSTPSDTMRFKAFLGMGILPAVPFKGDVYMTELSIRGRSAINDDIAGELKRRKLPLIVGPLTNTQEADLALRLGVEGLFVEKPEWLLQWLRDKK